MSFRGNAVNRKTANRIIGPPGDGGGGTTPPAAPSNLSYSMNPDYSATVSWTDNATNETEYVVQRSEVSDFATIAATTTYGANQTTHPTAILTPGVPRYYRVRCGNAAGNSAWSSILTVTRITSARKVLQGVMWKVDSQPGQILPENSDAFDNYIPTQFGRQMSVCHFGYNGVFNSNRPPGDSSLGLFRSVTSQNTRFDLCYQRQTIPMFDVNPHFYGTNAVEGSITNDTIANGAYDSYLIQFFEGILKYNAPVIMRLGWEMNGNWYRWGERSGGSVGQSTTGSFARMWRKMHTVYTQRAAALYSAGTIPHTGNLTWYWCPSWYASTSQAQSGGGVLTPIAQVYPGDAYVDWLGIDDYYLRDAAQTQERIDIQLACLDLVNTTKPIFIGEWMMNDRSQKAGFITSFLAAIEAGSGYTGGGYSGTGYSRITGQTPFNIDETPNFESCKMDNVVDQQAYAAGIDGAAWHGNTFVKTWKPYPNQPTKLAPLPHSSQF